MKSKATTYLLLAVVLAVWGVIGWKVLSRNPSGGAGRPPAPRSRPAADNAPDTLLLDYRDPFLSGQKAAPAANSPDPVPLLAPLPAAPKKAVKHNVRYLGRIRRKGVDFSLVEINNAPHTMQVGNVTDDYCLERIFEDSLHFAFGGEQCCIKLSQ